MVNIEDPPQSLMLGRTASGETPSVLEEGFYVIERRQPKLLDSSDKAVNLYGERAFPLASLSASNPW